jgi:transcriptional regulator with XRE-family HTH domain
MSAAAIGRRVAQLREGVGMKQAELAQRVTWSQAVLSRAEAGDRELAPDELQGLLEAIGTPEAAALAEIVARQWQYLPTPPLDHLDQDLLWRAERVIGELTAQSEAEEIRPAFKTRLDEYIADIADRVDLILRRDHQVAFMGAIGTGKSTAICRATGLEYITAQGQSAPVLETGAGGITLCDVSLKVGPGYGVIVTPRSAEEIRADVADFAEQIYRRIGPSPAAAEPTDESIIAVPREIERAIRNMSGLRPTRTKRADGKSLRTDPALEIAKTLDSSRELIVEVLSRMGLPRRDRSEAWYDGISHGDPLAWLAETFLEINNGRHPEFSLPARVDLIVPGLLETADLTVGVVDTRGLDGITARADLEERLLDTHTVSILCSGFNDAPEQAVQHLFDRAQAIGNPQIATHAALVVLTRADEALKVKDEAGDLAESINDGYELKGEQVSNALSPFGLSELPVEFYNAMSDEPERLNVFIRERIESTREGFRRGLSEVIAAADELLANVEKAQVWEVQREAGRIINTWLEEHRAPPKIGGHVHDTLMTEIRNAHASTVNAAIRREGEWYSLSYSHQLGFGARRLAVASLRDWFTGFTAVCDTQAKTHPEAAELLGQVSRLMSQSYEELLKKMQLAGVTLYREQLQLAQTLWLALASEWGNGPGYKERVATQQGVWFDQTNQTKIESEIVAILNREWHSVLVRVAAILDIL